ncbi:helix-turn-helix domain-containing protein [Campylobacter lari]|uniref:helix-turn-helix domain-containing protein n=1 Tax=Campylobacter lari TaxID=201 RepID=UPI00214A2366|nr:helix-turn-helix domain-containing protein [Campylobacter lari]MCR2075838.1 helix-turn-helix domain-containing protein [Campylobacter lari subsp. concheus]MCR2083873.1 helix-turn-helix domain-containing protein [Campylobacter lari subsp. concheus]MCR2085498.1 helix-turn-helix domain-containing protein [Campylobacter lari subsp. concheus]
MFGENLKKIRKASGLTQLELSKMLNTTQRTISLWETGNFEPPLNTILLLCDIFKVTPNDLLLEGCYDDDNEYLAHHIVRLIKELNKANIKRLFNHILHRLELEKLTSHLQKFKGDSFAKKLAHSWTVKGERILLIFYYFIEYLEKHNINENNVDKNLFLKLLNDFNLSKDNTSFILKEKDKRNLIEWVEKEMQEFEIKVLVAMLKDEIKTLIKKEMSTFHKSLV